MSEMCTRLLGPTGGAEAPVAASVQLPATVLFQLALQPPATRRADDDKFVEVLAAEKLQKNEYCSGGGWSSRLFKDPFFKDCMARARDFCQRLCARRSTERAADPPFASAPNSSPGGESLCYEACVEEAEVLDEGDCKDFDASLAEAASNAQRHAASSRLARAAAEVEKAAKTKAAAGIYPTTIDYEVVDQQLGRLQIAVDAEIWFFQPDDQASYLRTLSTKKFDGPSGHKVRWRSRSIMSRKLPEFYNEGDCENALDDAYDDWEEMCDEIADLMSQQRHTLLWSASW